MHKYLALLAIFCISLVYLKFSGTACAQEKDLPVLFKADQLRHERKLDIVVARGNVEITQGDRILRANTVSYNQKTDI